MYKINSSIARNFFAGLSYYYYYYSCI